MRILKIGGSLVIALYVAGSAYAHHSATGVDQLEEHDGRRARHNVQMGQPSLMDRD